MYIDRCTCTKRTFSDLLHEAHGSALSLRVLQQRSGAGTCCTMCGPYLRRAYRTGQCVFDHLLAQSDEPEVSENDRLAARPQGGTMALRHG
jgi:hypothetical protein